MTTAIKTVIYTIILVVTAIMTEEYWIIICILLYALNAVGIITKKGLARKNVIESPHYES